jgi:hypothetical protein
MKAAGAPGSGPGKLTTAQQEYVVQRLAAFDSPLAVARSVRDKFGISITRNSIRRYDPTRYPECAARWKELFYAARHAMLRNKGQAAALDRAVRVRGRARAALRALDAHADGMLEQLLRRIEAGSPPPCGPRRAERPLTDAERTRAILALLRKTGMLDGDDGAAG